MRARADSRVGDEVVEGLGTARGAVVEIREAHEIVRIRRRGALGLAGTRAQGEHDPEDQRSGVMPPRITTCRISISTVRPPSPQRVFVSGDLKLRPFHRRIQGTPAPEDTRPSTGRG